MASAPVTDIFLRPVSQLSQRYPGLSAEGNTDRPSCDLTHVARKRVCSFSDQPISSELFRLCGHLCVHLLLLVCLWPVPGLGKHRRCSVASSPAAAVGDARRALVVRALPARLAARRHEGLCHHRQLLPQSLACELLLPLLVWVMMCWVLVERAPCKLPWYFQFRNVDRSENCGCPFPRRPPTALRILYPARSRGRSRPAPQASARSSQVWCPGHTASPGCTLWCPLCQPTARR